jgi:hypothetical protein
MRISFTILFLTLICFYLFGQESQVSFGKITMQIDSGKENTLNITNAILYENASVDFDTTVQIQDDEKTDVLYYPQIIAGKEEILRFIIKSSENSFFDIIFNLGDSLEERIVYENASAKVFFNHQGQLNNFKQYTKNLAGEFIIHKPTTKEKVISGELNTTFDLPLDINATQYSKVSLSGTFNVYFGEFRSVSLSTAPPLQKKKTTYMKNIVMAMMMAAIGFFVFLAQ